MPIVEAARWVNQRQRDRIIEKLLHELKIIKGRTIALLGLAFKPNTDDLREAPAIEIAQKLIERGARVNAHDPIAMDRFRREHPGLGVHLCENVHELLDDCDAAVLVTEWTEYRELDWARLAHSMRGKVILDGRLALDSEQLTKLGFRYVGMNG
jgi:UDPglucose 6-dehydrogenase